MVTWYNDKLLQIPGLDTYDFMTEEGVSACEELIVFLTNQEPVGQLKWSEEMRQASKDHVEDIGAKGMTGHRGSDGSNTKSRCNKYVKVEGCMFGEALDFGKKEPKLALISLLTSDGDPSRHSRKNIFQHAYRTFSCYTGPHSGLNQMTCMNFKGSEEDVKAFMAQETAYFGELPNDIESWK